LRSMTKNNENMSSEKNIAEPDYKEFYNYRYWRETQGKQLTIASNVYFGFSSALIGYSINLLIFNSDALNINCWSEVLLILGVLFNLSSLCCYTIMTNNKLKDYRETAKLIALKSTYQTIQIATKRYGERTWGYFLAQKLLMTLGTILCIIAYAIIIFSK